MTSSSDPPLASRLSPLLSDLVGDAASGSFLSVVFHRVRNNASFMIDLWQLLDNFGRGAGVPGLFFFTFASRVDGLFFVLFCARVVVAVIVPSGMRTSPLRVWNWPFGFGCTYSGDLWDT